MEGAGFDEGDFDISCGPASGSGAGTGDDAVVTPDPPPNTAPLAEGQTLSLEQDRTLAITLAGTDADGDALAYRVVDAPASGTLSGDAPTLRYTPDAGFFGEDAFSFEVDDGRAVSTPASVRLSIARADRAPTAPALALATDRDVPLALALGGADADGDALAWAIVRAPASGTLSGEAPALTYTPAAGFTGRDTFDYRVAAGGARSTPATVTIDVRAGQPPPDRRRGGTT